MYMTMYLVRRIEQNTLTEENIRAVAKRLVNALVRTVPSRYQHNKTLTEFALVQYTVSSPQKYTEFYNRVFTAATAIETTKPMRVEVGMKVMFSGAIVDTADLSDFVSSFQPRIWDIDREWFLSFCAEYRIPMNSCGHFGDSFLAYTTELFNARHICRECNQTLLLDGNYVFGYGADSQIPILAVHAIPALDVGGLNIYAHRNDPNLRHNEAYGFHMRGFVPAAVIRAYHSRKPPFKAIPSPWMKSHQRAFGLELEVEARNYSDKGPSAYMLHKTLNGGDGMGKYCYFENDGSLGEGGFEIITQPAGLDTHREMLSLFLNNPALKKGLRSHEGSRCGFHVHVGREYLSKTTIYRIQAFLNDYRNEGLIRKIARRYGANYSRVDPMKSKLSARGKNGIERYEMLNVTRSDTVEFRLFRGSLKYESIMAALEFVNALCVFCRPGTTAFQDFTSLGFKTFLLQLQMKADTTFLRPYLGLTPAVTPRNSNEVTDNEVSP